MAKSAIGRLDDEKVNELLFGARDAVERSTALLELANVDEEHRAWVAAANRQWLRDLALGLKAAEKKAAKEKAA